MRFQENVYALLAKVYEAKKICIQKGNHQPTKEDIAVCAGLSVERLEKLLFTARMPLSLQKPVFMDQDTTFQVILLLIPSTPSEASVGSHLYVVIDVFNASISEKHLFK